jgi:hypothetical protein
MTETDPLAAAARLETSMDNLAAEVARQADEVERQDVYGRHNRQLIWGLVASVLFSLAMGAVAISASLQATQATSAANRNAENSRITCEAGNESRRLQNQLWTYVLDLSSRNPNRTIQQQKQIAQFRAYIATVFAPRDCDATPTLSPTVTPTR